MIHSMRRILPFAAAPLALLAGCAGRPAPRAAALPPLPAACGVPASVTVSLADSAAGDPLVTFDTAWTIIRRTHWDTTYNGVNWQAVREELRPRAAAARTRGELRAVLSDMVGRLGQSHFSIIPQEVADATGGQRAGSGDNAPGSAGLEVRLADNLMVVSRVDTGGPAWSAGVRPGWVVEEVRGCPMAARLARLPASLEPRRRAAMAAGMTGGTMGGSAGDTVSVTFRDGADARRPLQLTLGAARGSVVKFGNLPPLQAHLDWHRVQRDGRTVGVISFNVWMPLLAAQFDAAIDSLRDADAIVLDVRGNPGGVGGMAMGFAGHFLDTTLSLGTMHQRTSSLNFRANPRRVDTRQRAVRPFAGPLAVVVDPLSASTTEIFAAGLQQLGRATVFGTQSAGQALPSVPERLPNGDILYHAIADFIGPIGKPVEGDGVLPDQATPLVRRALVDGRDPALDAAITWAARQATRAIIPD
jgi:carboxyl-terminal processing protease